MAESPPWIGPPLARYLRGELLGLIGFGLLAASWALLPLWATSRRGTLRTRLVTGAGVALIAYLATFSILGHFQ